ncbi:MAG: FxsA family protein [Candidatus Pelagibacter sp. TMED118]|nr:MAG: FxsA family protein [Candidatus Pelagibacter sp. TMED118]|tara:strand:+ start:9290 stop:9700 length:411 start_codon:yes stop_codon:yes gene_type:complete
MNTLLIPLIFIPIIEIYLLIEIGSKIGVFTTIFLIISTALLGIWYAKYEGLNTLRSGIFSVIKNEMPLYEIISGAALAFAALLLIIPGFLTDLIGLLIIFPLTRKFLLSKFTKNYTPKNQNKNFIDGESEDLDEKK